MPGRGVRAALSALAALLAALALPADAPASAADAGRAGARAAEPGGGSGPAAAIARARALMGERRFGAALALLRQLTARHPGHRNARFLLGRAAFGAAREPGIGEAAREALLDEAVAAFRFLLVDRPELTRVRLELARTFFHKREDGLAREHFERVLAGQPRPAVAANVHRFLAAIRARKRWSRHVGVALAPDTNIGRGSDERTVHLGSVPYRRDEESLPRSGIGLSVWAGAEIQYPMSRRLRLRAGSNISRREHSGRDFDRTFLAGHLGPRWLADAATEVSLLASARRLWRGGVRDFDELGVRVEGSRRLGRRATAGILASWHERRHRRTAWLDGPALDLSARTEFVASPALRFNAGLGWARERPRAAAAQRFRHSRWWLRPGVSADLPIGITLAGSAQWSRTSFDGSFGLLTPSGERRSDRGYAFRVSVNKRDWTLFGFSPRISLAHERRTSNTQGADYRRTGAELGAVRLF